MKNFKSLKKLPITNKEHKAIIVKEKTDAYITLHLLGTFIL